jgi:hypothetical protein
MFWSLYQNYPGVKWRKKKLRRFQVKQLHKDAQGRICSESYKRINTFNRTYRELPRGNLRGRIMKATERLTSTLYAFSQNLAEKFSKISEFDRR